MDSEAEHVSDTAKKKAELIHYGRIFVPENMILPYKLSSSTAGPGAGGNSLALAFGGTRIKLAVTHNESAKISLEEKDGKYRILRDREPFIGNVEIIPTLLHAPEQAFVNLRDECIFNCVFCGTPRLKEAKRKDRNPDQVVETILQAANSRDCHSIAITSGIAGSPEKTMDEMVEVVSRVRNGLKDQDMVIGVEPYPTSTRDIDRLYKAGAREIKINIESFDRNIYENICPELDYDTTLKMLEHAVKVFGRGKVSTNMLVGLGESDQSILEGMEHLAEMGVLANIRMLRTNENNTGLLTQALGGKIEPVPPDRIIRLAVLQKKILERYGLTTRYFDTMCHRCGCCDIVPFQDV